MEFVEKMLVIAVPVGNELNLRWLTVGICPLPSGVLCSGIGAAVLPLGLGEVCPSSVVEFLAPNDLDPILKRDESGEVVAFLVRGWDCPFVMMLNAIDGFSAKAVKSEVGVVLGLVYTGETEQSIFESLQDALQLAGGWDDELIVRCARVFDPYFPAYVYGW